MDAEGRHAPNRAAVDHQGAHSSAVRCHPAVDQGLQRGKRTRWASAQHHLPVPLDRQGVKQGLGSELDSVSSMDAVGAQSVIIAITELHSGAAPSETMR